MRLHSFISCALEADAVFGVEQAELDCVSLVLLVLQPLSHVFVVKRFVAKHFSTFFLREP